MMGEHQALRGIIAITWIRAMSISIKVSADHSKAQIQRRPLANGSRMMCNIIADHSLGLEHESYHARDANSGSAILSR